MKISTSSARRSQRSAAGRLASHFVFYALLGTFASAGTAQTLGLPDVPAQDAAANVVNLGRTLFFDRRLSAHGKMSCATCHEPAQGFTQNDRRTSAGANGKALRRNASSILNVRFAKPLMHDGAAPSLEVQVLTPLLDLNEMGNGDATALERRLADIPDYSQAFRSVFGEEPTITTIGKALAAYQRTLVSGGSAFDRWKFGGEGDALSAEAQRGFAIFSGKGGCSACHAVGEKDALFTDNGMHNTGVASLNAKAPVHVATRTATSTIDFASAGDRGRHEVTQDPADLYRFRTPTLRNAALTAPYMHDGSFDTLEDVVRFYNRGGGPGPNVDPALKPLGLDDQEIRDVVAFLKSLTGDNAEALAREGTDVSPAMPR